MPLTSSFRFRHKISIIIIALIAFLTPLAARATTHHYHHKAHKGAPVDGAASYADIVIDAETGQIIHATNPDGLRHPASLTKMMTLYLTFQALESGRLRLDQTLPVSANAAEQSPSKLGLRRGQRIRVEDAILGLVTESANDAAVVIAEALGGSEAGFGRYMTAQAQALGMTNTRFDNPSGLPDPDQVTTARDMAMLGHALIYHYPNFYPYFSRDDFVYAGIDHHNHNHLKERYEGMDGIKTGYIRASGFNLVASARRGNTRLIGVVFGGHSATARDNHMAQLLDESFASIHQDKAASSIPPEAAAAGFSQGDSGDTQENSEYVALPAKVSAVFTPENGEVSDQQQMTSQEKAVGGGWGIQVGAYTDAQLGHHSLSRVVRTMPKLLNHADPVVQKVSMGNNIYAYRARLMGLDEKTARSVCAWLSKHAQSCMVVEP